MLQPFDNTNLNGLYWSLLNRRSVQVRQGFWRRLLHPGFGSQSTIKVRGVLFCLAIVVAFGCVPPVVSSQPAVKDSLLSEFQSPPLEARPWAYWIWMDGNLTREGITADLEAMHRVGIGGVIIMEVNVGIPRGPVQFMSPQWRKLFTHTVREAERLDLQITLNAGPG
jgi:hypothetical protein